MFEFEWDENKNKINIEKHEVSFETARQELWADPKRTLLKGYTKDNEERLKMVGGILRAAIFTIRQNKIRIISVRRARTNERKFYETK